MTSKLRKSFLFFIVVSICILAWGRYFVSESPNDHAANELGPINGVPSVAKTNQTQSDVLNPFGANVTNGVRNPRLVSLDETREVESSNKVIYVGSDSSTSINLLLRNLNYFPSGSEKRLELERRIIDRIRNIPDDLNFIIEQYASTDSEDERELLASIIAMSNTTIAETKLLHEVSFGDENNNAQLRGILKYSVASSPDKLNRILSNLASTNDAEFIESLILSIYPPIGEPDTNTLALDQVISYYDSSNNEGIKKAVVRVVGRWGNTDYAYIIEQALNDNLQGVRAEARLILGSSGISSESIMMSLIEIVRDESKPFVERIEAMTILEQYPINQNDDEELRGILFR